MILTHDPFQPTPDSPDWDPTTNRENQQKNGKHFAAMVAYMDKMIGRLDAKLGELGIRDNTILIFIGDNGTHSSITSRFKGSDFEGGKGKTTHRGHHVPMIVSWPAMIQQGRVNSDLINAADFLPTICEAAGVEIPANTDGVSFLPQLRGEKGSPREWLYSWYSPRQGRDLTVREFAFDHHFKLYRTGQLYDLVGDPEETKPLDLTGLQSEFAADVKKLQAALDQFKDARPGELDQQFQQSGKTGEKSGKKKKGKGKGCGDM